MNVSGGSANLVTAGVHKDGVLLYHWTPEVLSKRVDGMRELLNRCVEAGNLDPAMELTTDDDPWWSTQESTQDSYGRLIGKAQVVLMQLCELLNNDTVVFDILDDRAKAAGKLQVELWPVSNISGQPGIPDAEVPSGLEEPYNALIGTRMAILVKVVKATGLPAELATDVRVEYTYFIEDCPQQVPPVLGQNCNPVFNYEKTFVQESVTERFKDYLYRDALSFYVYGRSLEAERIIQAETSRAPSPVEPEPVLAPVLAPVAPTPVIEPLLAPLAAPVAPTPVLEPLKGPPAAAAGPVAQAATAVPTPDKPAETENSPYAVDKVGSNCCTIS
jgi:hypothetical protein